MGLFHAWSYVDFDLSAIVYPRPDPTAGLPPAQSLAGDDEGIPVPGDEDFAFLRGYRPGDPPRQIAWKALARDDDLLTKEFQATASAELWLDWIDARAPDPEARLSILAHWVIETERLGQGYGLRLPGVSIPPGRGEAHCARCLEALALHGEVTAVRERRRLPNATLDVRNVMWLLAAMTFVVAPHALRLPEWVGAFFALVVAWRAWIAWRATRIPPRWLILALTVGRRRPRPSSPTAASSAATPAPRSSS